MKKSLNISQRSIYPPYNSQFIIPMHLRYECSTASSSISIGPSNLCACIVTGLAAHGVAILFARAKLKRVEVRGISSAVNKITTMSLVWLGVYDSNKEVTGSGNTEIPAHFVTSPTRNSNTSFWRQYGDTGALFQLNTDADFGEGQVDVYFDLVYFDDGTGYAVSGLTAVGNSSTLYTPALDSLSLAGVWNTTPHWIPVGRTTIV